MEASVAGDTGNICLQNLIGNSKKLVGWKAGEGGPRRGFPTSKSHGKIHNPIKSNQPI